MDRHGFWKPSQPTDENKEPEELWMTSVSPTRYSSPGARSSSARSTGGEGDSNHTANNRAKTTQVKETLRYYQESATVHGVANTTGPHIYIFRRPLWIILVFCMAFMLSWTLISQITEYRKYPIKTESRMSLQSELLFPAVTICSLNQYFRSRVPDDPLIKHVIFYLSEYAQIADAHSSMPDVDNLTDVSGDELLKMSLDTAPRLEELFYLCQWMSKIVQCRDYFREVNTTFGKCYVFNSNSSNQASANVGGDKSGLRLILDYKNRNSYYSGDMRAGVKVIVHEPDVVTFPHNDGWSLRPGVAASISLTKVQTKRLPRPYKAFSNKYCEDTNANGYENKLKLFGRYSQISCLADCFFNHLAKTCGCRGYYDPGNATVCSGKEYLKCYIPARLNFSLEFVDQCACHHECDAVTYKADIIYADFSSQFIQDIAIRDGLSTPQGFKLSVVDVRIFYKTLDVNVVEQLPVILPVDILGNLGGQMGLFLGASIMSVVEVLEMLLLVMYRYYQNLRNPASNADDPQENGERCNSEGQHKTAWNTNVTGREIAV